MNKQFFIERDNKKYKVDVSLDRHFPLLRVAVSHKVPTQPIPLRWFWLPIGDKVARKEWLNEEETIEEQVDRMIEALFEESRKEKEEQSEIEKYFAKTP